MGLLGGGNSSTSSLVNNYDQRKIEENQNEGPLAGNKGTINYSNTGGEAFAFAGDVVDVLAESTKNLQQTNADFYNTLSKNQSEIISGGQTGIIESLGKNLKWVALAGLGVFALSKLG